jgi:hypothetical protein
MNLLKVFTTSTTVTGVAFEGGGFPFKYRKRKQ